MNIQISHGEITLFPKMILFIMRQHKKNFMKPLNNKLLQSTAYLFWLAYTVATQNG